MGLSGPSVPQATAELIADRGSLAESDDLFRCRAYLDAEGVTHTLRLASSERTALVPLIVREIAAGGIDATSPYAYPGGLVDGAGPAPEPAEVDWSPTGLVSVFARERLAGEPWLGGVRRRGRVLLHDPAKPRQVRARLGEQVRANERDGWTTTTTAGPTAPPPDREAFAVAYEQTMRQADAAERYFFASSYFDAVLSFEHSWLVVARRSGEVGAAAIAARSDGVLHYFLGGTADPSRKASPFKNVVVAMLELADELELPLNLGGGIEPGDGLEEFKRGFANAELPFHTHEVVCDSGAYERLSDAAGAAATDFFPAYRA